MSKVLNILNISKSLNFHSIRFIVYLLIISYVFLFPNRIFSKSTFSAERIKSAISELIQKNLNTDVDIEFITTVRTTEFDDDKIDAEIVFTSDILPGINTIAVKFSNSERILKYNELNVRIKLLQDVWVASESIPVNSIISEKNLVLEKKYLQNSELPLDISQLIGRETSRSIKKGEIITKNQLADEVLIKRGEKVILIVHSGNVKVRCTGTAVQDGISGQQIRVKRDMSQAVISGKVADDGTVMIFSNTFTSK